MLIYQIAAFTLRILLSCLCVPILSAGYQGKLGTLSVGNFGLLRHYINLNNSTLIYMYIRYKINFKSLSSY